MAKKTPEINATSTADIAFLLLVFFLATTTMNVDSGIYRRLPPYQPDNTEAPKYAKRNILQVLVNRNNQLAINGELADVSTLKDRTIEFVLNPNNSEDLPQKEIKTIDLFGPVEVSKGIVSLQSDKGTSYEMYIAVQDQLTSAYNELRNRKANEKWGENIDKIKTFEDLSKEINTKEEKKLLFKELINKILNDKRMILIIDELDRCNPFYATKMLETIKHFYNLKNVTVIIVTNNNELKNIISQQFGAKFNSYSYLNKFYDYIITVDSSRSLDYCKKFLNFSNDTYLPHDVFYAMLNKYKFTLRERSEERRVGKECRSRWSPYH